MGGDKLSFEGLFGLTLSSFNALGWYLQWWCTIYIYCSNERKALFYGLAVSSPVSWLWKRRNVNPHFLTGRLGHNFLKWCFMFGYGGDGSTDLLWYGGLFFPHAAVYGWNFPLKLHLYARTVLLRPGLICFAHCPTGKSAERFKSHSHWDNLTAILILHRVRIITSSPRTETQ